MWNQDKGWQAGIEALKGARKVYGKDGEGVREFGRIVLRLLEDGEGGAGAYVGMFFFFSVLCTVTLALAA